MQKEHFHHEMAASGRRLSSESLAKMRSSGRGGSPAADRTSFSAGKEEEEEEEEKNPQRLSSSRTVTRDPLGWLLFGSTQISQQNKCDKSVFSIFRISSRPGRD